MALVKNSLTLDNIIIGVKHNRNIVWYVSRNGTVKKIKIVSKMRNHNFVREHNFKLKIKNLNNNKDCEEEWLDDFEDKNTAGGSGRMYDFYYKSGHFFSNPSDAFDYLLVRLKTKSTTLVKTAKSLLSNYPEFII